MLTLGVILMTAAHEALVILYMRGITKDKVGLVMLLTGILAVFGYVATLVIVKNDDLAIPMTIGHMLGVPLGLRIPIGRTKRSETASPTPETESRSYCSFSSGECGARSPSDETV
jgi:hypothetical protein